MQETKGHPSLNPPEFCTPLNVWSGPSLRILLKLSNYENKEMNEDKSNVLLTELSKNTVIYS